MKKHIPTIIRRTGAFKAWRYAQRKNISILCVHGVMDYNEQTDWQPLWERVDTGHLEHVLNILNEHYNFIPLGDAIDMLKGEVPVKPNSMVLTFDDGYKNNYTHAMPILEKLGIPATFYVCTGMLDNRKPFWIDRLDYAIQHLPAKPHTYSFKGKEVTLDFSSRSTLARSYRALRLAMKSAHTGDLEAFVEQFAEDLERESGKSIDEVLGKDPWASVMSWEDAEDALGRNVDIDSHTIDHVRLGYADEDRAAEQLRQSREHIRERLRSACRSIAYPNGSYTDRTAELTKRAGYDCGITTDNGVNKVGDDMYRLKRLSFPWDKNADHILAAASGMKHVLNSRLKRH